MIRPRSVRFLATFKNASEDIGPALQPTAATHGVFFSERVSSTKYLTGDVQVVSNSIPAVFSGGFQPLQPPLAHDNLLL